MTVRTSRRSAWVRGAATLAGCIVLGASGVAGAVDIVLKKGAGFDDSSLGLQRAAAFAFAASEVGALLNSPDPERPYPRIVVDARFSYQGCDGSGALLGTAGSNGSAHNHESFPFQNTLYPYRARKRSCRHGPERRKRGD